MKNIIALILLTSSVAYSQNTFPASGNVGIGTTTPEAKLTISQIGNGWYDGLRINRDASNYLTLTEDVTDVRLKNWGTGGIRFFTSIGEQMTILNNGKTGLGTSTPESNLDVYSSTNSILKIRNESYTNGYSELRLDTKRFAYPGNSAGLIANASGAEMNGIATETFGIYSIWRPITIAIGDGSGNTYERLRIQQNGNVGIGTTTPGSFKLAVEGKIGAREVNVTTAAWSDYVFKDDYHLRSLTEVQEFIKENHHLPDVPSEKEVLQNGQDLGAMNAVLLKKIEELTLYMIELKKRDEAQQMEIEKLKHK